MSTATALQNQDVIDFQEASTQNKDVVPIVKELNTQGMGFIAFFLLLRKSKVQLNTCLSESMQEHYKEQYLSMLLSKMIETYFFRRFILKTTQHDKFIELSKIPDELLNELQEKYKKDTFENGISYASVEVSKGSKLDKWIQSTYLAFVSKVFKGVFGYSASLRYACNQPGTEQEWEKRFFNKHANFHWDQELNSFTMIVYLSDVQRSDGAFKILPDSKHYTQNLYLSIYNRFITDTIALDHIYPCGDRVGSYIEELPADKEHHFIEPAGTVIKFYGRHIMHDGGFPDAGGSRIALFIDQRNYLMKPMQMVSRLLARAV